MLKFTSYLTKLKLLKLVGIIVFKKVKICLANYLFRLIVNMVHENPCHYAYFLLSSRFHCFMYHISTVYVIQKAIVNIAPSM